MNIVDEIVTHIRSGCQAMRIVTPEEFRALKTLEYAAKKITELDKEKMRVITWDADAGFNDGDGKPKDPISALRAIPTNRFKGDIVFVFKDFHPYLREPVIQRTFRNLRETNGLSVEGRRRPILFLNSSDLMPSEIRRSIVDIDFHLPDDEGLEKVYKYVHSCVGDGKLKVDNDIKRRLIVSMRGMTEPEAECALFYAIHTHKNFIIECADTIEDEKSKVLKSNGVLTYIPKTAIANEEDIGGYEEFRRFIKVRSKAYSDKARALGLTLPKGVVLLGPPGVGKTTVGKITAKMLGLPLVMMDFGAVFGSLVGESEARMKTALSQVSSLGGCVLIVDDADKAFRNATNSAGDSGTTQRVFQQFLVWRSEYKGPVFVILTMNTTDGIPPELLRPGRFDAVMCSLLPEIPARRDILGIHMRKRNIEIKVAPQEWDIYDTLTEQFSGAEIESTLDEATYLAFDSRNTNQPTFAELEECLKKCVPTAKRDAKTVQDLIEYCKVNKLRSVNECVSDEQIPINGKGRRSVSLKD